MSKEVRPAKELWNFLDSEYVKAYHGGRIEYTKDFYIAMYKKITEIGKILEKNLKNKNIIIEAILMISNI